MTATLLLTRHGATQSNIDKVYSGFSKEDITEQGHDQLDRLSQRLKGIRINAIYSSPLKRTLTTAMRLSDDHGVKYTIRDDLNEIDLGDWEGLSKGQIKSGWPKLWDMLIADPGPLHLPGGESFAHAMSRATYALEEIARENLNKCAVIVTHDIIIKMMVIYTLNAPTKIYHNFQIDCATLTKITVENGTRRLVLLNELSDCY